MRAGTAARAASRESTLPARLAEGIDLLGVAVNAAQQDRLLGYLQRLAKWNAVFNLTSVRDIGDMLPVHLLDSLSMLPLVDAFAGASLLDVGSGAGLPGIPLAIARSGLFVTTVDAVGKKISFQQQVKGELPIENLHPVHARVEALTLAKIPEMIVSRAYTAITDMLASIEHLAGPDTTVVAMKGAEPTAELVGLPDAWSVDEVRALDVPELGARRCAVVLRRRR